MLTSVTGKFVIPVDIPSEQLIFMKSGYTSAQVEAKAASVESPVVLWPLPLNAGLYFLTPDFRYQPLVRTEPKPFAVDETIVYGIPRLPELPDPITPELPAIVLYNMPTYDLSLARLQKIEAASLETPQVKQTIWAQESAVPVELLPVDQPNQALYKIKFFGALDPGVYAITWGGLDRYKPTDARLFLFRIGPDESDQQPASEKPESKDLKKADAPKTKKKTYPEPEPETGDAPLD